TLGDRVAVMRAGILQQVDSPRVLYDHPKNIFVAGFIGSPAMNFFTGSVDGDVVRAPMGDIPLHDEVRRALEQHGTGKREVIIGVRPEDFEDAQFAPAEHEGWAFEAPIELTESMGAEIYAHFDFEQGQGLESDELRELQEDAGTSDVPQSGASGHAVARVDAQSSVRAGERAKLWLDVRKLHLFDPGDGHSLTRSREAVGAPV
ncbi:MAG: multiple sugar transport system ATP-binding protein, partial [Thermoleophilaceae bacterium]|nr:multiple sugar transport system ATP-binding protein [Thermoleophilaceae bacterium]